MLLASKALRLLCLLLGLLHLPKLAHSLLLRQFYPILSIDHLVDMAHLQLLVALKTRLELFLHLPVPIHQLLVLFKSQGHFTLTSLQCLCELIDDLVSLLQLV